MFVSEKERRKSILAQIDALEKQRCDTCCAQSAGINCKCKAAVEIRKLGKDYESVSQAKRKVRIKELLDALTYHTITVEAYDALKCLEVCDRDIVCNSNISMNELLWWRFDNELLDNQPRHPRPAGNTRAEYAKWSEVAKMNGISKGTFSNRIHRQKMSYEEAATRKLMRGRVAAK